MMESFAHMKLTTAIWMSARRSRTVISAPQEVAIWDGYLLRTAARCQSEIARQKL